MVRSDATLARETPGHVDSRPACLPQASAGRFRGGDIDSVGGTAEATAGRTCSG